MEQREDGIPAETFPEADEETRKLRQEALDDLRGHGLSEAALQEIATLWRREDEVIARARAEIEEQPTLGPAQRARVARERAIRQQADVRRAWEMLRDVRKQCEEILDRYGRRRWKGFQREVRVEGLIGDSMGGEVTASVWATAYRRSARAAPTIHVEVQGSGEELQLHRLGGGQILAHQQPLSPPRYGESPWRMPTASEARAYQDVVLDIRSQQELSTA